MTNNNPFIENKTANAYASTDPVYKKSAELALEFCPLIDGLIVDLGAGTGVSSAEILQQKPGVDLHLVEPSAAMIDFAKKRLGSSVQYHQASAENLDQIINNAQQIYALNCVHLFPNLVAAAHSIATSLADDGVFVFNLSAPSLRCQKNKQAEIDVIKSNTRFYQALNEVCEFNTEIIASTARMLNSIVKDLENNLTNESDKVAMFNRENIAELFASANMKLEDYHEAVIEINSDYQKNIWRMVAAGFLSDDEELEKLIAEIPLSEVVPIRQGLFKLCKQSAKA